MGVIVTRHTTGSSSVSGSGAYTYAEKSNMEMEMEFKAAYLCYYKELTYNNKKQLINVGIWITTAKSIKIFNKDLSYNNQKQLIQTDLTRIADGIYLISDFDYNAQKQLVSVTRSGTACPSSSSSSSSVSSSSSSSSESSSSSSSSLSSSSSSLSSSSSSSSESSSSSSSSLSSSSSSSSTSSSSSSSSLSSSSSSSSSSESSSSSSSSLSSSSSSSSTSSSSSSSSLSSSSSSSSTSSSSSSSSTSSSSSSSSLSSSSSSSSSSLSSSSSSSSSSLSSSSSSTSSSSSSSSSSISSSSSSSSSSESSSSSSQSSSSSSSTSFAFVEDPDTDDFDPNSKNYRVVILDTEITNDGTQTLTRVLYRGHSSQDTIITGSSIQKRKDTIEDYLIDPVRLTFDNGSNSTTISGGIDKWSDWVTFSLQPSADHLIHVFQAGTPHYYKFKTKSSTTYILEIGQDHTLTTSISADGYSLDNKHYHVVAIDTSSSSSSSSISSSSESSSSSSSSSSESSSSSSSSSSESSSSTSSSSTSSSSASGVIFLETFNENMYQTSSVAGSGDNLYTYNLEEGSGFIWSMDYPTTSVTGTSDRWGTELCRVEFGDTTRAYLTYSLDKDHSKFYFKMEFLWEGIDPSITGEWIRLVTLSTSGGEWIAMFNIDYSSGSTNLASYIRAANGEGFRNTTLIPLLTDTSYVWELYWNVDDEEYESRLNGVPKYFGAITGASLDYQLKNLSFGPVDDGGAMSNSWFDIGEIEIRSDDWAYSSSSSSVSSSSESSSSESSSSSSESSSSSSKSSSSSSSSTAPGDAWVSYFDNTKWSATTGSWNGSGWDDASGEIDLAELGTWVEGFRPTKLRMTYTGDDAPLELKDTSGSKIVDSIIPYTSLNELTITFDTDDIASLLFTDNWPLDDFTITDIEFFGG